MQLGAIEDNPATKVFPPKLKTRTSNKIKYFDNVELKQFLTYLDTLEPTITNQKNITIYKLLLTTGLRVGEALALSWSDINFSDKSVSITKTLIQQSNVIQEGTKTKESNRILFLDSETIQLLKVWQKNQNDGAISLHDSLVFPYHQKTRTYELEKLKLVSHFNHAGVPNIGFHGFRHTHASLLLNSGIPYKELQYRLGHSTLSMTMDIYSHLSKENAKKAVSFYETALKAL